MNLSKRIREQVYNKYNGRCAYTGHPLDSTWQVDHVTSKATHQYNVFFNAKDIDSIKTELAKVDDINNLVPCLAIINHYKRSLSLEGFRKRMLTFHQRLAKLPKTTRVPKTEKRIQYMTAIANLFAITKDKPFSGVFYFEAVPHNPVTNIT